MRQKLGSGLMKLGLLLIAAAFLLVTYNIGENRRADRKSKEAYMGLTEQIEEQKDVDEDMDSVYGQYPDVPMPVISVDGNEYIGILEVPKLELNLPVISQWSDAKLQNAPCRYRGSVYSRDMILAGHNYASHFGKLKSLALGDEIRFTDVKGHVFTYQVIDMETLPGTAVEQMESGTWDLTLFTCTYDGRTRVTVRCAGNSYSSSSKVS